MKQDHFERQLDTITSASMPLAAALALLGLKTGGSLTQAQEGKIEGILSDGLGQEALDQVDAIRGQSCKD